LDSTTWDGQAVSPDPPFGAAIVVHRQTASGTRQFLVLHRRAVADDDAWAWGPPSGARWPGEDTVDTARRELFEETGLAIVPVQVDGIDSDWVTFQVEIDPAATISLSIEHDRFDWLPVEAAIARVSPEEVRDQLRAVATSLGVV
jgi:8-oxo-dGTP pyrophosphatase MutT (NUDIX family)